MSLVWALEDLDFRQFFWQEADKASFYSILFFNFNFEETYSSEYPYVQQRKLHSWKKKKQRLQNILIYLDSLPRKQMNLKTMHEFEVYLDVSVWKV